MLEGISECLTVILPRGGDDMPADKTPAFQFYPKDFLSSDSVSLMTSEQVGAYMLLLCHSWLRPEGLPSELSLLSRLARIPTPRFAAKVWPAIAPSFKANAEGLYYNARLERARSEQEMYRAERSQSGKRGAASRWASLSDGSVNGTAIEQPMAKNSSSSSSAVRTTTSTPLPPRPQSLHGRRNPDLMTYGPIALWASQFRDVILPLVATHYGGDRDAADTAARSWVADLDNGNRNVTPSSAAVRESAKWWKEKAFEQWAAEPTKPEVCPICGHPEPRWHSAVECNTRFLAQQREA